MRYLPHTDDDISAMLKVVGVGSLEELFSTVPEDCRKTELLKLPDPLTEWELDRHMTSLTANMATMPEYKVFVGAGSYEHFVPSSVSSLLGRSEFVTSYTPYQPEVSQGTLQGIFEYQTLICRLLRWPTPPCMMVHLLWPRDCSWQLASPRERKLPFLVLFILITEKLLRPISGPQGTRW